MFGVVHCSEKRPGGSEKIVEEWKAIYLIRQSRAIEQTRINLAQAKLLIFTLNCEWLRQVLFILH